MMKCDQPHWGEERTHLVIVFAPFFFFIKIFTVRRDNPANSQMNTILIQNYNTVQYTVYINGVLQCSVDEDIFVCLTL